MAWSWSFNGIIVIRSSIVLFSAWIFFLSDKNFKTQNIGISIVFGWLLSVCIIGIIFKLMYWPGSSPMLLIGTLTAVPLIGVAILLYAKSTDVLKNYYKNLLIRTSVLFILSLLCFLLPNSVLINHYYSNEPELKELYLKEQENPEDENIQKEIQAYKAKQFEQENGKQLR